MLNTLSGNRAQQYLGIQPTSFTFLYAAARAHSSDGILWVFSMAALFVCYYAIFTFPLGISVYISLETFLFCRLVIMILCNIHLIAGGKACWPGAMFWWQYRHLWGFIQGAIILHSPLCFICFGVSLLAIIFGKHFPLRSFLSLGLVWYPVVYMGGRSTISWSPRFRSAVLFVRPCGYIPSFITYFLPFLSPRVIMSFMGLVRKYLWIVAWFPVSSHMPTYPCSDRPVW